MNLIFDTPLLRTRHRRAAPALANHNFLITRAAENLRERLSDIKRTFPLSVWNGLRSDAPQGFITMDSTLPAQIKGDQEFLPFAQSSLDLFASNFTLHNANDLPGALIQIRRALKPDGLFLAAMAGGETLFELRQSLQQAEMELKGGLSPRVHPFASKQDMGALLQRAGFALPVVDSEIITITYENMFTLMADLRGMGAGNTLLARHKQNPGRAFFHRAAQIYAEQFAETPGGRIEATIEIIYLIGWAPHENQQKPLKPGSAEIRLADALGAKETKL